MEYRLSPFPPLPESFVAVSSSAATVHACGGTWKSLDAETETASQNGDGTSSPSTGLSRHSPDGLITPIQTSEPSFIVLFPPDETSIDPNLVNRLRRIHGLRKQTLLGRGMAMERQDSVLSLPDWPWDTTKS